MDEIIIRNGENTYKVYEVNGCIDESLKHEHRRLRTSFRREEVNKIVGFDICLLKILKTFSSRAEAEKYSKENDVCLYAG